jgi:polysaccharide export outer membrane protein
MKNLILTLLLFFSFTVNAAENPLGAGDMLRISVYGNPDLTTETRVNESGEINFPLVGEVSLGDKSVSQAEKIIASQLEKMGFLRQPQVNIIVTEFSSLQISVLGNVYNPGRIPLNKPTTITDVLAQAGGISPSGSDLVTIISFINGKSVKTSVDIRDIFDNKQMDIPVSVGDVVYVHGSQISVLGNVGRPGKYSVTNDTRTITDFLALAGGISPQGSDTITIIQNNVDNGAIETIKTELNIDELFQSNKISLNNFELSRGDVIYVPREPTFYIYGEVNRSGSYRLEADMTVAQALAVGGGVTLRGTESGIKIKRNIDGKIETIDADTSTQIETDDVIYIKESLF